MRHGCRAASCLIGHQPAHDPHAHRARQKEAAHAASGSRSGIRRGKRLTQDRRHSVRQTLPTQDQNGTAEQQKADRHERHQPLGQRGNPRCSAAHDHSAQSGGCQPRHQRRQSECPVQGGRRRVDLKHRTHGQRIEQAEPGKQARQQAPRSGVPAGEQQI